MKITKVIAIKDYKSFVDFEWQKFCKYKDGQESVMGEFTVIFGENGSGKSAICNVLKNISENQGFQNIFPTLAEVEINDEGNKQIYKYENGNWKSKVDQKSFLFFDVDFVNANVHTHGTRSSNLQHGAHTQKAGELIISLDAHANELDTLVRTKKRIVEAFSERHKDILEKRFTENDNNFFENYKDTDNKAKQEKITDAQTGLENIKEYLKQLNKANNEYTNINRLSMKDQKISLNSPPSKDALTELFTRQITEEAQDEASEVIKRHFMRHKQFIEYAKDYIPENYTEENCPLCMQPLANATEVIEYYRVAFDQTYKKAKQKFLTDIETTKKELEKVKSDFNSLPLQVMKIFDDLEKIKNDFGVPDIYNTEEKTEQSEKFNKINTKEIDNLIGALESLKKIEREQVDWERLYVEALTKFQQVQQSVGGIEDIITEKGNLIIDFKNKYSDQSRITNAIQENTRQQTELNELIDFLKSEKIMNIKQQKSLFHELRNLNRDRRDADANLITYLAEVIPKNVISQMITILEIFNLNFVIKHTSGSTRTKDYSFSFKICDQKGNERKLKDGLSEGERQLISLAFFFAINKNLPNKNKTVLIFDDPITSLDSPNLKILSELIHQQTHEFAQVLVFTHHPLFFKYLAKCTKPAPCKFGILKNADQFGGSFMFCDPGFNLAEKVRQCNREISQQAKNGILNPEEIALKYGQLLRLAIEKFIKHDLLMWDKESRFDEITGNLKQGKSKITKLSDDDLESLTNIYKYCNYSNLLHVDKEMPSALSELTNCIDRFVKILDKIHQS